MTAREITQDEARKLYDEGRPIAVTFGDRTYAKWWQSAATRHGQDFAEATEPRFSDEGEARFWRRVGNPTVSWDAPGFISRREPFEIGNLSGTFGTAERNELPEPWWDRLRKHIGGADSVYIIHSFRTPIAWEWSSLSLGGVGIDIPPVRYSMTTTQHLHLAARALGVSVPQFTERSERNAEDPRSPYGSGGISRAASMRAGA